MPESLIQLQHAWADHVRDPARPPPPGIDARRLAVYRRLCIDSLDGLLGGSLPRLQHHLGPRRWRALVEAYYAGHVCTTPLFTQIAAEFAQWLGTQQAMTQPAWAAELAHFESSQQALRIEPAEAVAAAPRPLSADDVLTLSTQVRVLGYRWPVHVCEPGQAPWSASAPATPSLLLMRRLADFELQLEALSPLAYALLMIFGEDACRVDAALQALAVEHALTVAELQPLCAPLLDALWAQGVLVPAPLRR